eukprot:2155190-Lingulodinium_polyedra.AAC.1
MRCEGGSRVPGSPEPGFGARSGELGAPGAPLRPYQRHPGARRRPVDFHGASVGLYPSPRAR